MKPTLMMVSQSLLVPSFINSIDNFHNGGQHESPGSRSERPTHRVASLFVCNGEHFERFVTFLLLRYSHLILA